MDAGSLPLCAARSVRVQDLHRRCQAAGRGTGSGGDAAATSVVIRAARSDDYSAIASVMDSWWGRPVVAILPRLFLEHFHPTSHVAEDQLGLAGFVVGFLSPANPELAYIHTVAVRSDLRSAGVARQLYERFFAVAHRAGRTTVSAVTSPGNLASVEFHRRMGFSVDGPVPDYHGPGQDRIVFVRRL